jgi:hypothetical protein
MNKPSTITMREFANWSARAKPGDRITYCMGEGVFAMNNAEKDRFNLRPLFELVHRAYKANAVALFQQEEFGTVTYLAMKVRPGFHEAVKDLANGR